MKYMLELFSINGYRYRHTLFFDELDLIISELVKDAEKIFRLVITYMLSNDIHQVFFGLGWLMIVGVIYNEDSNNLRLSNDQLIRILKATLYFSVDNSKTCKIAFQLLNFIDETPDKYITFCMDDLYKNYPGNISFIMKQYEKETFSFETYSFDALEFIICRYYGYLPRVKREQPEPKDEKLD